MKKTTAFLIMLFFLGSAVKAQYTRYIVQFTNKINTPYSLSNSSGYLSDRSLQRRLKQHILPDSTDLPIDPAYIDSITSVPGVILLNRSKWFNQVLVQLTDTLALPVINAFDFVKKTAPVALSVRRSGTGTSSNDFERPKTPSRNSVNGIGGSANINSPDSNYFSYGNNYAQIHIHNGEYLHNNGFRGQGLQIAILDAGFYHYLINPAFDSVRLNNQVLGTWDYVNNKQSVDEENDHGAFCFSIMAANEPGLIIGSAPKASYWLFKTEDVNSEYPVEEQNWVAAAEFADSAGVDLISTSLGYAYFDNASFNQVYTDRNGHGTLITQAANLAVAKGMIVTASVGNSGTATDEKKYALCPADGDSVLAVGATDANGVIAPFSSVGPNASGQIKPDVVSVGENAVLAWYDGSPTTGNGTSYSNPNLAGLVACLWQSFPELSNTEVTIAVRQSANRFNAPDNQYGFGIPDFKKATALLQQKRALRAFINGPGNQWIRPYPVPFSTSLSLLLKAPNDGHASITLIDAAGRTIEKQGLGVSSGYYYVIEFNNTAILSTGVYFIRYDDGKTKKTVSVVRQ